MPCLRTDLLKQDTGSSPYPMGLGRNQITSQVELSGCVVRERGVSRDMFTGSYSPPLNARPDLLALRLSSPMTPTPNPPDQRQQRLTSLRRVRPFQVLDLNSVRRNLTGNNLISLVTRLIF